MNFLFRNSVLIALISMSFSCAYAGKVKKGFEALAVYDYFKAKNSFSKGMKYNPSPSGFGLATVYARTDNPFHSLDSADRYIRLSRDSWELAKERKKLKWAVYGWTINGIDSLQQIISSGFFLRAKEIHTVDAYQEFITHHGNSLELDRAIHLRDSLAFFNAVKENSSSAYKSFLNRYPKSSYASLARDSFYDSQFEEITKNKTLASYVEFLELNPNSPLVGNAEDRIFEIVTQPNTKEAYEAFLNKYAKNRNRFKAWKSLYGVYLATEYSASKMREFLAEYKGIPEKMIVEINHELTYVDSVFLPIMNGKYGFMSPNGIEEINGFDNVSFFSEGLVVVQMGDNFGVINKKGQEVIPFEYDAISDFHNGLAVVEQNGKMGMVHRNGRFLFDVEFNDLGIFSEGLVYGQLEEKYGYYDETGRLRIPASFDDAFDFSGGIAKVEVAGLQALIDIYGTYVVPPVYERLDVFSDSLYIFEENGKKGLTNYLGKAIVEAEYDEIGKLSNGLAVASLDGEIVYIDDHGEVAFRIGLQTFPNYLLKGEFVDGTAIAFQDEVYGRINTSGEIITEFDYDNLGLGTSVIPFEQEELWGVMSLSNKILISPEYYSLEIIDDRYILAENDSAVGVLDLDGNTILPFVFEGVTHLSGNFFAVRNEKGVGLYRNGEVRSELNYDEVSVFQEDFILLSKSGVISYFDLIKDEMIIVKSESGD
ncbi:MAG: WG repeat-containing protein [Crocinitomicaceae bacterium]|nr:WG repeat-containing protein [Crocinitomicaceae bacterium]